MQTNRMDIHGHGTGIRYQFGLTLLELLITIALAAILLVGGIPAFGSFVTKQRMKAAVSNLHSDLLMARSQAVYQNKVVVACPSPGGKECSGGSDWSHGWIVFEDDNRDRQRQQSELLLRHVQSPAQVVILSPVNRREIRFFPDGSAPGSNASISLCGQDGPPGARKLVISNIGRIRRDTFETIESGRCPA